MGKGSAVHDLLPFCQKKKIEDYKLDFKSHTTFLGFVNKKLLQLIVKSRFTMESMPAQFSVER